MRNKFFKYIFIFCLCFIFNFIFVCILSKIYCDEVWVYGFTYNISKGLLIYKDFNVLQMPLYFFIGSFFLKVFGNYIISLHVFDSLLISFMCLMMYKKIGYKSFLVILMLSVFFSGYNLLSLFLFMCILYLIDENKCNDFVIGIIIGLIFITKQNIGIVLFFPYIFFSHKKLKSVIYFILPFIFLSVYFIMNNSFLEFLDCTFGSMIDFNNRNKNLALIVIEILVCIYLIKLLFKDKFKDKRLLYILFFQFIVYPICDDRHMFIGLFPVVYVLLSYIDKKKEFYIFSFIIVYFLMNFFSEINLNNINFKKNIFYLKNDIDVNYSFLEHFNSYVLDYDYYFISDWHGYVYKLYYDIPINNYDLMLSGNAGYNGIKRRTLEITDICKNSKCLFVTSDNSFSQWWEFNKYIVNNYRYVDSFDNYYLYSNVND